MIFGHIRENLYFHLWLVKLDDNGFIASLNSLGPAILIFQTTCNLPKDFWSLINKKKFKHIGTTFDEQKNDTNSGRQRKTRRKQSNILNINGFV